MGNSRTDRAVFVFPSPIDAVAEAGGTMARIVEDGGTATLVTAEAPDATGERAIARLMGGDHVVLAPEHIADLLADRSATVVIVSATASAETSAARNAAETYGLPVFESVQHGDATRSIAVDRQYDGKLDAISALVGAGEPPTAGAVERFQRDGATADEPVPAGWGNRLATAGLALIIGIAYGVIGTVAHQSTVDVGGITVPWGIVVAVLGVAALLVGLRLVVHDRLIVAACALGLIGTVALLSLRSFGGSVLIPQGATGLAWTAAPALIAALVLAWPNLPARSAGGRRA